MNQPDPKTLLEKVYSKIQAARPNAKGLPVKLPVYSSHWEWYLKSKKAYHPLADMLSMRRPMSAVTRGFGLDRRFSPSYDYYIGSDLYQTILSIPESDFGSPEKLFPVHTGGERSGIFLRNACYAYNIVTNLDRARDDPFVMLEIGPGFGMLAYILKRFYRNSRLVLVDLPESLSICAWYLQNALLECTFVYLPADGDASLEDADVILVNADAFTGGLSRYDLAINCDSMSEMTAAVSCNYLRIMESDVNDNGMFFFLNKEGIDKQAVARPTLYPFSERWKVKRMQPTYVGLSEDYRHIQMCLQWRDQEPVSGDLRNDILDIAYKYFFKERLECFGMFEFIEDLERHLPYIKNAREFFLSCLKGEDLDWGLRHIGMIQQKPEPNDSERIMDTFCMIVFCDLLIDAQREDEAQSVAAALATNAQSFSETWATARILARLALLADARALWASALIAPGVSPSILLRAGKQLLRLGQSDLAQRAFEGVINEDSCPAEKIEAIGLSPKPPDDVKALLSSLPEYFFSTAYHIVRMADALYRNERRREAHETLVPIISGEVKAGHYDLFIAAQTLEALGRPDEADPLIQESIRIGHNDNGFYRRIGLFFEERGDYSGALKYLKLSLDIDGSWASSHYDIARVYQKLHDPRMELEHLKEALSCSHNKEVDYDSLRKRLDFLMTQEGR